MRILPLSPLNCGQKNYNNTGFNKGVTRGASARIDKSTLEIQASSPAFGAVIGNASHLKRELDVYVHLAKKLQPENHKEIIEHINNNIRSIRHDRNMKIDKIEQLPAIIQRFSASKANQINEEFVTKACRYKLIILVKLTKLTKSLLQDIKH